MRIPRQVIRDVPEGDGTPDQTLPVTMNLDDADTPVDVLDALLLDPFVTGRQPYSRTISVERVRVSASLLPPDARAQRSVILERGRRGVLATGPGWTLKVQWTRSTDATLTVTAVSDELARTVLEAATHDAVEPEPSEDSAEVTVGFWSLGPHRPNRRTRPITTPSWDEIRVNYPSAAAAALGDLMTTDLDTSSGRLLLIHGPPGTGKTTALRALARGWRSQCQFDVVLDPERLFTEPSYLMDVAIGSDDDCGECESCHRRPRWRLLLLEDCDELIRSDAKEATGQALSRLLNLTDGILGQGLRVLVAISTNEELARLHPAVSRPGRCLAQIEVGRLSRAEAVAWLGRPDGIGPDGATLAELFALRDGVRPGSASSPPPTGLYL